jgi:phage tail sheath protein FI
MLPGQTDYAAVYFPWIQVFDPATKAQKFVPPSGHMAGIYARVDTTRGVHKAPANEVVFGATGLKYEISKAQQDGLNPHGVDCIRRLNGNVRVWGARTVGGSANPDHPYVSTRRLFIFLRESIDRGLQWAVFEPNNADLWAKITRGVSAFLHTVWRSGALFGGTPQEAFFVKCDAETNPPAVRDAGQVVTEIGVALTKPAEFVVFKLGQKTSEG